MEEANHQCRERRRLEQEHERASAAFDSARVLIQRKIGVFSAARIGTGSPYQEPFLQVRSEVGRLKAEGRICGINSTERADPPLFAGVPIPNASPLE